jgi:2'-5' RNA ligase
MILKDASTNHQCFSISFNKLGFFAKNKPKILYIGVYENQDLNSLYESIITNLKKLHYRSDGIKYTPHLTIGRIKSINNENLFKRAISSNNCLRTPEVLVDSIHLYESKTTHEGPVYKILNSHTLGS